MQAQNLSNCVKHGEFNIILYIIIKTHNFYEESRLQNQKTWVDCIIYVHMSTSPNRFIIFISDSTYSKECIAKSVEGCAYTSAKL